VKGEAVAKDEVEPKKGKVIVEYVQAPYLDDYRIIEADDPTFQRLGIKYKKLVWSRENKYRLDISDGPSELRDYFLSIPNEFKVTEE
jgi:hypothetical protein